MRGNLNQERRDLGMRVDFLVILDFEPTGLVSRGYSEVVREIMTDLIEHLLH